MKNGKTQFLSFVGMILGSMLLAACSKASEPTPSAAQDAGPNNAFTNYIDSRLAAVEKAKSAVAKANEATAHEQQETNATVNPQ